MRESVCLSVSIDTDTRHARYHMLERTDRELLQRYRNKHKYMCVFLSKRWAWETRKPSKYGQRTNCQRVFLDQKPPTSSTNPSPKGALSLQVVQDFLKEHLSVSGAVQNYQVQFASTGLDQYHLGKLTAWGPKLEVGLINDLEIWSHDLSSWGNPPPFQVLC